MGSGACCVWQLSGVEMVVGIRESRDRKISVSRAQSGVCVIGVPGGGFVDGMGCCFLWSRCESGDGVPGQGFFLGIARYPIR